MHIPAGLTDNNGWCWSSPDDADCGNAKIFQIQKGLHIGGHSLMFSAGLLRGEHKTLVSGFNHKPVYGSELLIFPAWWCCCKNATAPSPFNAWCKIWLLKFFNKRYNNLRRLKLSFYLMVWLLMDIDNKKWKLKADTHGSSSKASAISQLRFRVFNVVCGLFWFFVAGIFWLP